MPDFRFLLPVVITASGIALAGFSILNRRKRDVDLFLSPVSGVLMGIGICMLIDRLMR